MRLTQLSRSALVAATLVATAVAASINVNGTCEVGMCSVSDSLAPGASVNVPFTFMYTFANSDRYQGTGTIAASSTYNTNGFIRITASDLALTYLGNSTGTVSAFDTLVIDFLQYFETPGGSGSNTTGFEYITGDFSGAYGGASSVTGQVFTTGGTSMAVMGPFFPPNPFVASNTNQPVSGGATTSLLDYRDTVVFGAESGVGATIRITNVPPSVEPVPEPATWLLGASGLVLATLLRRRFAPVTLALMRTFLGISIVFFGTSVIIPNVAAQRLSGILNKAKTEAQKAASETRQTVATAQSGAIPAETWYMYCTVMLDKFASAPWGLYVSDVFPYDHSEPKAALSALSAWETYIKENYGTTGVHEGSCDWNSGPKGRGGEERIRKNKEYQVNQARTFDPANPTAVFETGWTYTGGVGSTCIDHSVASGCVAEAAVQQQPPRGMPSRRNSPRQVLHWYCSSQMGQPTVYFSAPFDTTDGVAASSAYKQFLERRYGYHGDAQLPCFGNFPSLAAVREDEDKRITDMRDSKKWKIVETGWTYAQ
jgi:MYXO-CTERM domain-containing protein